MERPGGRIEQGRRARHAYQSQPAALQAASVLVQTLSSTSIANSEDFSELNSTSANGSFYGAYGFANGRCSSVRDIEKADFDMNESEEFPEPGQTLSLPLSIYLYALARRLIWAPMPGHSRSIVLIRSQKVLNRVQSH